MRLIHVLHPRALAMILGALALGAGYFAVAAPAADPGVYVFTPTKQAFALPARRSGDLPEHRPDSFYLLDPEHYDPPLNPSTARLSLLALPTTSSPDAPTDQVGLEVTVMAANPRLYSIRSPQLDGPWVRMQYQDLTARSAVPTRPVLALTLARADGQGVVVFSLSVGKLW